MSISILVLEKKIIEAWVVFLLNIQHISNDI